MTASISILPVIRVDHAHEGSLSKADDLSNVARLDAYRRKEQRTTEYSLPEGYRSLGGGLVAHLAEEPSDCSRADDLAMVGLR